jgi:hypothetical protein
MVVVCFIEVGGIMNESSERVVARFSLPICGMTLTQEEADEILDRCRENIQGAVHAGFTRAVEVGGNTMTKEQEAAKSKCYDLFSEYLNADTGSSEESRAGSSLYEAKIEFKRASKESAAQIRMKADIVFGEWLVAPLGSTISAELHEGMVRLRKAYQEALCNR